MTDPQPDVERTLADLGALHEAARRALAPTWTYDKTTGRENSSPLFREVCDLVERLILDDARKLLAGRADMTARLIVAQLAHKYGFAPTEDQ